MSQQPRRDAGESASSVPDFTPVSLRYRHDGLTPARQVAYIRALAECGCVREACRRVGVSPEAVYELARRPDGQSFRVAWELALDIAVRRLSDEAFSRCINGVAVPHYYKGELVGEHRRYDERLTMFILRYRDPRRYGKHLDRLEPGGHCEEQPLKLGDALAWVEQDARRDAAGRPRQVVSDLQRLEEREEEREEGAREAPDRANLFRWGRPRRDPIDEEDDPDGAGEDVLAPDVASTSSTSAPFGNRAARRRAASKARKR
jgi:hypothetical protein